MKHFTPTICFITLVIISGTNGCSNDHLQSDTKATGIHDFHQEEVALLTSYMTGDVVQARQSLKQSIQQLKASAILDRHDQAGRLYADYIRLYALETRTAQITAANDALMLAQYWRMRGLELPEATNDADIIFFMSQTPDKFLKYVEVLDAGDNGSKPQYLRFVTNSPPPIK